MELVGQENELSVLRKAWHDALGGQPQVVALTAEPRLGNTTLCKSSTVGWTCSRMPTTTGPTRFLATMTACMSIRSSKGISNHVQYPPRSAGRLTPECPRH